MKTKTIRILAIVLVALMCLSLLPLAAFAAEPEAPAEETPGEAPGEGAGGPDADPTPGLDLDLNEDGADVFDDEEGDLTGNDAISGQVEVGEWDPVPGGGEYFQPLYEAYPGTELGYCYEGTGNGSVQVQWLRGGAEIPGATGGRYTAATDDVGSDISCVFSISDCSGSLTSVNSIRILAPALSGSVRVGHYVPNEETNENEFVDLASADVGKTITALPQLDNASGTPSYQWLRDGTYEIPGATEISYTLTADDAGCDLSCVVTYSGNSGYVESAAVAGPPLPALTGDIKITPETPKTGDTLVATVRNSNNTGTLTFEWRRDGEVIEGVSGDSYVTTADDAGKIFTCKATSSRETGEIGCVQGVTVTAPKTVTVTLEIVEGHGTVTRDGAAVTSGEIVLTEGQQPILLTVTAENGYVCEVGTKKVGQSEYQGNLPLKGSSYGLAWPADGADYSVRLRFVPSSAGFVFEEVSDQDAIIKIEALAQDGGVTKYSYTDVTPCWDNDPSRPMSADEIAAQGGVSFPLGLPQDTDTQDYTFTVYHYKNGVWTAIPASQVVVHDGDPGNLEVKNYMDFSPFAVLANEKPATGTITIYRTSDKDGEKNIVEPVLGEEYTLIAYHFNDGDFSDFNTKPDGSGTAWKAGDKVTLTAEKPSLELYVVIPFTGTVELSGDPYVGETLTAMLIDDNNTGTLSYQWMRDGAAIKMATASTYTLVKADLGKKITCVVASSVETGSLTSNEVTVLSPVSITVTFSGGSVSFDGKALASGDVITVPIGASASFTFDPDAAVTSVKQDGKEVGKQDGYAFEKDGTLDVTFAVVTLGGKQILDQEVTTAVTGIPEGKTPVYQWTRAGAAIEGAAGASYTLTDADAGKEIRCVVTDAAKSFTAQSEAFTPAARPAAPTGVRVEQHIVNDTDETKGGHVGRVAGLNGTMQVATNPDGPWTNVPASAASFTSKVPIIYYIRYKATDTAPSSAAASVELKHFVTAVTASGGSAETGYKYSITLSEKLRDGTLIDPTADPGEDMPFLIPYPSGLSKNSHNLTLVHDTDGKTVSITQQDNGILGKCASFSPFTLNVGSVHDLTGTLTITGDPYVGEPLTAVLTDTNNTGTLSYVWLRDGATISGATSAVYTPTDADVGKKISCRVTSSSNPGNVVSGAVTVQATQITQTQDLINDGEYSLARIVGVSTDMEYSLDGGAWTAVDALPFEVSLPGVYRFRTKGGTEVLGSVNVTAYYSLLVEVGGSGGTVSAIGTGTKPLAGWENCWLVPKGGTTTLTFTPYYTTHTVTYLTVDGQSVTRSRTIQFKNVAKAHTIVVTFGSSSSSPRTGDASNLGLWSAMALTSLAALGTLLFLQKKRRA